MKYIFDYNKKVSEFLSSLGIENTIGKDGYLEVDRTSMVQNAGKFKDEEDSYKFVLQMVRDYLNDENLYLCWGGRTDIVYGLEVYQKKLV